MDQPLSWDRAHNAGVPRGAEKVSPGAGVRGDSAPALRLLFWETTAGCNLACAHCRRLEVSRQLCRNDLSTEEGLRLIRCLPETGRPIVVFSGGEPLMRPDLFELASEAARLGLPTALATNGTIMDEGLAQRVRQAGFRRVSVSLDGPDAETHDGFRGIPGAFASSVRGFALLRQQGLSMQINATVARHNYRKLDAIYELALSLGADALHIFMLVPVGCGMTLGEEVTLNSQEYEAALNWIYDRSQEGRIHLKATCAPHYFRVMHQRAGADGQPMPQGAHQHRSRALAGGAQAADSMAVMTKGCLAGQSVCFVSHQGEVFPCGYLPVSSGNVRSRPLPAIWQHSPIFRQLRDEANLRGKCGLCQYKKLCMGCRARAYALTGDYLGEEPNCSFVPSRRK